MGCFLLLVCLTSNLHRAPAGASRKETVMAKVRKISLSLLITVALVVALIYLLSAILPGNATAATLTARAHRADWSFVHREIPRNHTLKVRCRKISRSKVACDDSAKLVWLEGAEPAWGTWRDVVVLRSGRLVIEPTIDGIFA